MKKNYLSGILRITNAMNIKKTASFFVLIPLSCLYYSFGQPPGDKYLSEYLNMPSPNAASLMKFQEYPVSLFTGLPQIDIPIYEVQGKGISVPIKLSYHSSGFKPDEYPGWVGMNWALFAGGGITRKVNGFPDENPLNGYLADAIDDDPSRGGDFDRADDFYFNVMGYSGKFYLTDSTPINGIGYSPGNPEFRISSFSAFNEINSPNSSSTYENSCYFSWCSKKLASKISRYQSVCQTNTEQISGFRIILPNGLVCDFGRKKEDIYAAPIVDKSVPGLIDKCFCYTYETWHLVRIMTPDGKSEITFEYGTNPGELIGSTSASYSFKYTPAGGDPGGDGCCPFPPYESKGIGVSAKVIFPRYLQTINSENASLIFYSSASIQLSNNNNLHQNAYNDGYTTYASYSWAYSQPISRQLDSILILHKNLEPFLVFNFNYTNHSQKRLKLLSILKNGQQFYNFSYNDINYGIEPPYGKGFSDSYGFYTTYSKVEGIKNDMDYLENSPVEERIQYLSNFAGAYFTPPVDGMLNKISFQTGGYTTFHYESNSPEYAVGRNNLTGEWELTVPSVAPGLRIQSVKQYDRDNTLLMEKSYEYSQGILHSNPKYFWTEVFRYPYHYVSDPIYNFSYPSSLPMSSNGSSSPVTYSKVTETDNNGKTVYYYRNYMDHPDVFDELYSAQELIQKKQYHFDDPSLDYTIDVQKNTIQPEIIDVFPKALPVNSYDRERGQLILKKVFNNQNSLLSKEKLYYKRNNYFYGESLQITYNAYLYNSRPYSLSTFLGITLPEYHMIKCEYYNDNSPVNLYKKVYFYYPDGDSQKIIKSESFFEYDTFNRLNRELAILSNGDTIITKKLFSPDYDGEYYELDKEWIAKTIKATNQGKYLLGSTYYQYDINPDKTQLLNQIKSKEVLNPVLNDTLLDLAVENFNLYNTIVQIKEYNEKNNPSQIIDQAGITSSLLWGYNDTKLIAKVVNASSNEIFHDSYEYQIDRFNEVWNSGGSGTRTLVSETSRTGKQSLKFSGVTAAWSGVSLKSSITVEPGKKYVLSCWYFGQPGKSAYINWYDWTHQVSYAFEKVCTGQWEYMEHVITAPQNCTEMRIYLYGHLSAGADLYYDEIRFHPADAQMTTYTHDPLIGMTSQTDPNGQTIYYEYDDLGRLVRIRDHENNLLQEYKYNYATQ